MPSDRELEDTGLTRADVFREVRKPNRQEVLS